MCRYKDGSRGKCSDKVCGRGFTREAQKEFLVEEHNEFRRKIAKGEGHGDQFLPGEGEPPAANIEEIEWNDEIARIAQRWADQCPSAISNPHDQVRSMKGYPHQGFCGQNVYFKSSSNPIQAVTIAEAVGSWFHEIDDFDPAEIASFGEAGSPSGEVDHLTALVWHSTNAIGCGYVVWEDEHNPEFPQGLKYHEVVVCNYCPGGNVAGDEIYEPGPPGADCPEGYHDDDGLCAENVEGEVYDYVPNHDIAPPPPL